jgi:hypothetical protein
MWSSSRGWWAEVEKERRCLDEEDECIICNMLNLQKLVYASSGV